MIITSPFRRGRGSNYTPSIFQYLSFLFTTPSITVLGIYTPDLRLHHDYYTTRITTNLWRSLAIRQTLSNHNGDNLLGRCFKKEKYVNAISVVILNDECERGRGKKLLVRYNPDKYICNKIFVLMPGICCRSRYFYLKSILL